MKIGNIEIENPIALGPMAGVTDWAFRTVCAELGANVTVTEMVSSRALVYKDKKSAALLRKNEGSICGAQIFGNDPQIMAQGAQLALEISGCDFLDINMGCPMPKIANSGDGCGLMRTPELAGEIVKSVVAAVDVPVTVKCRLGWDKGSINVLDFTKRMEDCGAAMVSVHGRTRSMLYSGVADHDMITKVKQQLFIPVIANGDIVNGETAVKCLKRTGADGIMIGRGIFHDPFAFEKEPREHEPKEYFDLFRLHLDLFDENQKIENAPFMPLKRFFKIYVRNIPGAAQLRKELMNTTSTDEARSLIDTFEKQI